LVVANQGSGTLVLVDLSTDAIVGRFSAVVVDDGDDDDRGDHDKAVNVPKLSALSPTSGTVGSTFTLTITGTNLLNANDVQFVDVAFPGKSGDHDRDDHGKGPGKVTIDTGITVTGIVSTSTTVTATVKIAAGHALGTKLVRVLTPNGSSSVVASAAN